MSNIVLIQTFLSILIGAAKKFRPLFEKFQEHLLIRMLFFEVLAKYVLKMTVYFIVISKISSSYRVQKKFSGLRGVSIEFLTNSKELRIWTASYLLIFEVFRLSYEVIMRISNVASWSFDAFPGNSEVVLRHNKFPPRYFTLHARCSEVFS